MSNRNQTFKTTLTEIKVNGRIYELAPEGVVVRIEHSILFQDGKPDGHNFVAECETLPVSAFARSWDAAFRAFDLDFDFQYKNLVGVDPKNLTDQGRIRREQMVQTVVKVRAEDPAAQIARIQKVLAENGCDCDTEFDAESCLACRIQDALLNL